MLRQFTFLIKIAVVYSFSVTHSVSNINVSSLNQKYNIILIYSYILRLLEELLTIQRDVFRNINDTDGTTHPEM